MSGTAIVLMNLGGPDRPEAVRPFLYNLFADPAIIRAPGFVRLPLAWWIAKRRALVAQAIYAELGGGSPLLANTHAQARALELALADLGEVSAVVAMRYWAPFSNEAAETVQRLQPHRIVLLPLYPQYSTTTTASSLAAWAKAAGMVGLKSPEPVAVCCWPEDDGLITAMAELIRPQLEAASAYGTPRLIFSAHGLPEKIVTAGDPYPTHCELTAAAIVAKLGLPELDWVLAYQSRVGRLAWIGPSTDAEINRAGADKRPLVVAPIAFVSEHSETLVEIEIEYRKLAAEQGVPFFARVETVGTHPAFIESLARIVRAALARPSGIAPGCSHTRVCPADRSGCPMSLRQEKAA